MISNPNIEKKLSKLSLKGLIVPRTENNPYLKVSYRGNGDLISDKWNIKIYTSGSLVCNDTQTLNDLLEDRIKPPDPNLKLIQIDDAGWGHPLCGVLIGVTESAPNLTESTPNLTESAPNLTESSQVMTDVVDVSFFKEGVFEEKSYLDEYARLGRAIVEGKFKATPDTHRIEICTGYINKNLKNLLREKGFDVRVTEIKGLLQDKLEFLFKEYIKKELKADLAYDPKEFTEKYNGKKLLAQHYYKALNWGRKHAPHLIKSGWKSIGG